MGRAPHGATREAVGSDDTRITAGMVIGFGGLALSAAFMVYLHIAAGGGLNSTMSEYVLVDGVGWMFGASTVCMAVGALGAVIGLSATGVLSGNASRQGIGRCLAFAAALGMADPARLRGRFA